MSVFDCPECGFAAGTFDYGAYDGVECMRCQCAKCGCRWFITKRRVPK